MLNQTSRVGIAHQLADWLPVAGHDLAADPLHLAESLPIYTPNPDAGPASGWRAWLRDTHQHFHLLWNNDGPRGYARTLEDPSGGHRVHAVCRSSDLPGQVVAAVVRLHGSGVSDRARLRLVSMRSLGLLAVWAVEGNRSVLSLVTRPAWLGVPADELLPPREFLRLTQRRLKELRAQTAARGPLRLGGRTKKGAHAKDSRERKS